MLKSYRTTLMGIVAILSAIVSAATPLLDTDPATNPDWTSVSAAIAGGLGLIFARDNKVTSEEAGAK